MVNTGRSASALALQLMLLATMTVPQGITAQGVKRLFPSRDYQVRLLAAPRAPATGAKLVFNTDAPSEFGNTVDGEVALGVSVPIYLISGTSPKDGLVVGMQGAVFGRFTLTTITRDMISTDWIFAVPLTWHLGDNWLRFQYHHTSAHIGDEYIERFNAEIDDYSRDAADFTGFYQASPVLGLYGGGNYAFNVHPTGSRRLLLRAGAQAESTRSYGALSPYFAVDVEWEQNNEWEPRMNIQLGVRLPDIAGGRSLRLALEYLAGPSPQGQFRHESVRHFTLGFSIDP